MQSLMGKACDREQNEQNAMFRDSQGSRVRSRGGGGDDVTSCTFARVT